jgi:glycerol-3-phosphate dehydrogenase (NAD(P)+)
MRFLANGDLFRIAVIGAGSWGTALANLLAEKDGLEVALWVREEEVYREIKENQSNETFLPDIRLSPALKPVFSFEEAVRQKELVLIAVPSHVFREVLEGLKGHLTSSMSLMMATKGIENDSLMIMSQVVEAVLGQGYLADFACLAGPSFAKEVVRKFPTAVTIACENERHGQKLQRLFSRTFSGFISAATW